MTKIIQDVYSLSTGLSFSRADVPCITLCFSSSVWSFSILHHILCLEYISCGNTDGACYFPRCRGIPQKITSTLRVRRMFGRKASHVFSTVFSYSGGPGFEYRLSQYVHLMPGSYLQLGRDRFLTYPL